MWIKKNHKAFLRSQKVDLVCLQEAKLDVSLHKMVKSLGVGSLLE